MNTHTFTAAAITPANDAAAWLAHWLNGELTTNHDFHDPACVMTKQPWPTVIFGWGHVDFLPMVDEAAGLLVGFEVHAFSNDTAGLFADGIETLWDVNAVAIERVKQLALRLAKEARNDK